jgi:RNA polymerase sigma-70 factor (sigma-E family)
MTTQPEQTAVTHRTAALSIDDPQEAFRRLSLQHVQEAYRLAWAILGDASEAEEAAQDAFTLAWRSRRTLREVDRFDAWFGRILVNTCRDRLRRRRRKVQIVPGVVDGAEDDSTGPALDRDELYRAVRGLDADQRIAVILRYWNDMTVDEIAQTLGIPSGTVKSRLHRAMARLRTALEGTL